MPGPKMTELAPADHGVFMAQAYIKMLLENPDTILRSQGQRYEVYEELLRDDQVMSTFQQRRTGLTSKTWHVEPASDTATDKAVAEFVTEQLERIRWDDKVDKMLYGIFFGFAVAECMWARGDGGRIILADLKVRDRKRFRFNRDHDLFLISTEHPEGVQMPPRKFWTFSAGGTHDDNPYGQGLAHSLYWPVFFKRNDIKFWLIFLEKFGMPTTAIRIPSGQMHDARTIEKAEAVIDALQADSGAVIPDNMVVELIEAGRSGTADYDALVDRMDKAISKVVLSQTMTTDNGSSRSQAEVHQGVSQAVIDADADLINDSFTSQVVRWLVDWNFPGADLPFLRRNTEPEEDLKERAERDGKIYALGYKPTPDYIEETYGAGWEPREDAVVPPELLASGQGPLGPEFAEIGALLQARAGNRADQQAIADAAKLMATKYRDLYGDRVERLLSYLEESEDVETFRRHLTTMLAEAAPQGAVDTIQRATLVGRLMGMLRGQR